MARNQTTATSKKFEKLYQIEVTHRGPEGIIARHTSNMTSEELAKVAAAGAKEMIGELDKDTESAEIAAQ